MIRAPRRAGILAAVLLLTASAAHAGRGAFASDPAAPLWSAPGAPVAGLPAGAAFPGSLTGATPSACDGWLPNRGQIADGHGQVARDVLFATRFPGGRVYLTTRGFTHLFTSRVGEEEPKVAGRERKRPPSRLVEWSRLDLELVGATIRPEAAVPGRVRADRGVSHFYLPHCPDGVLDVPSYGEVVLREVYPGVDWVVRGDAETGAHHDFVVKPGGDPARIRFEISGATAIELSPDGRGLTLRTALGDVREGALLCTQGEGKRPVAARFRLEGRTLSFDVGDYDRAEPLVIDPPMVWSTYFGGEDFDGPNTVVCDNASGSVYVVGYTASDTLQTLAGGYYQGVMGGSVDGLILKFSQLGALQWATYYGGGGGDYCTDAALDPSGNLFVSGGTGSSNFPVQFLSGAYNQLTTGGGQDGFFLKFNSLGARQWATYYGGSGDDQANGIACDPNGKLYACGQAMSTDLPLQNPGGGAFMDLTRGGSEDAFVARFGTLHSLEWATYVGGDSLENAAGITVNAGRLYVTGYTWSPDFPLLDPLGGAYFQPTLASGQDAFFTQFTPAGVLTWSTFYGGDDLDTANDPVILPNGNVTILGFSKSTDLPTWFLGGAYNVAALSGGFDLYLAEFTPGGVPVWGTYFGGSGDDWLIRGEGKPITVSAAGEVVITGVTASSDFPTLNPGGAYFDNTWGGGTDAILARFLPTRALSWSTYLGTTSTDFGNGVAFGTGGCLFATGESWEYGSFPIVNPGLGALVDSTNHGIDDIYVTKFCTPNSACCQDFTCVPALSQAHCFSMGGTAFYPNQPCANVSCTILCTICGKKFHDLNRNGVQDSGEPALAGWTLELYYPNGPLYATTVTDGSGNYCFSAIPCGTWEVRERNQSGWVATAPAGGVHSVTLGTGSTQNGVNFANFGCAPSTPCIPSPSWLAAWWPLGDGPGSSVAADAAHLDPARNVAQLEGGASLDSTSLGVATAADGARVPHAGQLGLDFGDGSFSIAAWLRAEAGTASPRVVAARRALDGGTGTVKGWAIALDGMQAVLDLHAGGSAQSAPGPDVAAGTWSHVAVTLDRAAGQGRWYLDGVHVPSFDFTPLAGDVTAAADLTLGRNDPGYAPSAGFDGRIGDLALFTAALSSADVAKAAGPGLPPIGFCPEYVAFPAVTTICQGQTSRQVCFTICNSNPTAQTYQWSLAGLPSGAGCTDAGPLSFSPASGSVTVPAGGCSTPICVTIQRPAGFTAQNATSCFAFTFLNAATGRCQTRTGKLRVDNSCWCATPPAAVTNVAARIPAGTAIGIGLGHPCDPPATLAYRLTPEWLDPEHPDPVALSLNGLPPGMPVTGEITLGSGSPGQVDVVARYPKGYDPFALYEIVLEADTDGDGIPERLAGAVVRPAYDSVASTAVPSGPGVAAPASLRASPNPFFARASVELVLPRGGDAEVTVFDLGGRRVRTLARGSFEPGEHRLAWNGHDDAGRRVPAGIYFLRAVADGRRLEAKLVKLR